MVTQKNIKLVKKTAAKSAEKDKDKKTKAEDKKKDDN